MIPSCPSVGTQDDIALPRCAVLSDNRAMNINPFKLITFAWAAITLLVLGLLLQLDIERQREALRLESRVIYEFAYERTLINEVILHNFVELVETDYTNTEAISNFSRALRDHYPHIRRLQVYQRVDSDHLDQHEQQMRQQGYAGYRVHDALSAGDSEFIDSGPKTLFYPITFVEPLDDYGVDLLGADGYSIRANQQALIRASYYLTVFATDPYPLEDGQMGFRLMHAIDPGYTNSTEASLIIGLVLSADELLPPLPHIAQGLSVSLFDNGTELIKRSHEPAGGGWLLPRLEEQRSIVRFGQSSDLLVQKQLFWRDMNWVFGLIVLMFSLIAYLISVQGYRRRQEAEQEMLRLNKQFRDERDQLELRVMERTQELVSRNSELRQQVKENRNLTQKVLDIQEGERRNIARELHDEMGQALTAIRTDAKLLQQVADQDRSSMTYIAASAIDSTALRIYGVTYGLMRSLRPSALDDLGLVDALKQCVDSINLDSQGIELHLQLSGALNELPESISIHCYRMVQEGLNNCVKHAGASNLWLTVRLISEPVLEQDQSSEYWASEEGPHSGVANYLCVQIEDDGVGFATQQTSNGFGLIGMRERALANNGQFKLDSAPGRGTRIEIKLPVIELGLESEEQE